MSFPLSSGQRRRLANTPPASASALISRGPPSMSVKADRLLRLRRLPWALFWRVWQFVQDHRQVHRWLLFENYPYFAAFSSPVIVCLGNWSAWLESNWQAWYRWRRQCEETLRRSFKLYWWEWWSHWNRMIIMTACNHRHWHGGPEAGEHTTQDRKTAFWLSASCCQQLVLDIFKFFYKTVYRNFSVH